MTDEEIRKPVSYEQAVAEVKKIEQEVASLNQQIQAAQNKLGQLGARLLFLDGIISTQSSKKKKKANNLLD